MAVAQMVGCGLLSPVWAWGKRERVREYSPEEVGMELDFGRRDRTFLRPGP